VGTQKKFKEIKFIKPKSKKKNKNVKVKIKDNTRIRYVSLPRKFQKVFIKNEEAVNP
jgi:hypothetical protein